MRKRRSGPLISLVAIAVAVTACAQAVQSASAPATQAPASTAATTADSAPRSAGAASIIPALSSAAAPLLFLGNMNIAPVVYLDGTTPAGLAVDLVHALAPHMSRPIEIRAMDWAQAQALVADGQADALIQINATDARRKIYDFSDPFLESHFSVFVRQDQVGISGISSLEGLRVGVESGGLPQQLLGQDPQIKLSVIPSFPDGFRAINAGSIDAVVVDYRVGSYVLATNGINGIKVAGDPISSSYSSIAVKKGNAALLNEINDALRLIKADGTYQRTIDAWAATEGVFETQGQIDETFYHTIIVVLVILLLIAVIWLVTINRQMRKRRAAEVRQREQYSTLRGIIDGVPALVFSVDRQYRYTSFNAGHAALMKAIYGASIQQGHSMLDYMTVAEDRETARHNLDRAAAGEHLAEEGYSGDELRTRRYFHVSHSPIRTDQGEIIGVAVLAQDMTERRSADEALHASEERYRRFVEDDVAGVFITTRDGRVLTCNPAFARMFGFASVGDVLATNVVTIYQDHAARDAVLAELQARGRIDEREMAWQRLDGSPVAAVETAIGDFDAAGDLVAIRGYVIDVTERKRLEEQLRQSQKMEAIGRLAGGVAHDFNNLLTAINGYADILAAGMAPDDERLADVEEIRKAGDRAAALTRQLLAFSRRQVLKPAVIDLRNVVAGIAPMLRRLVGEHIELRAPQTLDLGRVRADPSQIEQVLLNLVVNARDAMPAGGTLTIETANSELDDEYARTHPPAVPGPYVLLAVSDTGTGMDETTMAHLFEPFFTTKALGEGTGLGLATVYGIVSQSGGHVTAYSEPGHGSTFKVFLPRVADTVEPHTPALAQPAAGGAETILLVEDEDAVRSFVERVLGRLGYTVTTAHSGDEAFALAADHAGPIDLLVTDVMLPGLVGSEISKRLTALRPSLRTLFISGYTEDSIVHGGELGPGVAFLSKPFTPDALGHAVRAVLDGRQTQWPPGAAGPAAIQGWVVADDKHDGRSGREE
jgi:two-component system, cell cycle sensor histidine kinase and response regulator CckA